MCLSVYTCVFLVPWTQLTEMGEDLYHRWGTRSLCKQAHGVPVLQTLTVRFSGLGFALGKYCVWHPFRTVKKMPSESTLLHFTCLPCRNSAYSRNKTVPSTKPHTLPSGTGDDGVGADASPAELNHSDVAGLEMAPDREWGGLQCT
ncbi:hypothetical protein HJG60_007788 [Phyllostomus discolor]|uniref:Uncharacterized protein n=1 Tax=Phyllostomus discolor TaxID=89673 RepID=A0A834ERK1_9CHIR|nr:hypothetical protein HJG60_007788 [Phyllostomus discolor]